MPKDKVLVKDKTVATAADLTKLKSSIDTELEKIGLAALKPKLKMPDLTWCTGGKLKATVTDVKSGDDHEIICRLEKGNEKKGIGMIKLTKEQYVQGKLDTFLM